MSESTPTRETLLVVSKVREAVSQLQLTDAAGEKVELRVGSEYVAALNEAVYELIERSARRCLDNKRKTLSAADV